MYFKHLLHVFILSLIPTVILFLVIKTIQDIELVYFVIIFAIILVFYALFVFLVYRDWKKFNSWIETVNIDALDNTKNHNIPILPNIENNLIFHTAKLVINVLKSHADKLILLNNKYKNLLASVDAYEQPLILIDNNKIIDSYNKEAKKIFGRIENGRLFSEITRDPILINLIDKIILNPKAKNSLSVNIHIDEKHYKVLITPLNIVSDLQKTSDQYFMLISFNDDTERYIANKIKNEIISNASHEIKTPLTVISGISEILRNSDLTKVEKYKDLLITMDNKVNYLNNLLDDLMESGRNQENSVINKKEENIIEIIKEAINEKQNNAKSNNQVFAINFNKDKYNINIVKNDIYRVFLNLFDNAIKYSLKNSKIDINIKLSDKKDSNWQKKVPVLIIDIADKGPGIKKEHLSRLTERFYRIDNVRNQQKGGKGLGLSIVQNIITEHEGQFIIKSEYGRGSNFTIYLPVDSNLSIS